MFGLSARETLVRAIKNACRNEIGVYKSAIMKYAETDTESSADEIHQHGIQAKKEYTIAVLDAMMASFRVSSQGINARIRMILWDPRITGIPNEFNSKYFEDNGYSAGITYAICYFAVTNKKITPRKDYQIISMLNHYQSKLMDEAIDELEET